MGVFADRFSATTPSNASCSHAEVPVPDIGLTDPMPATRTGDATEVGWLSAGHRSSRGQAGLEQVPPVPGEHPTPTRGPTGKEQQVRAEHKPGPLALDQGQVVIGPGQGQLGIADDLVPVPHHVGLGHGREMREVVTGERREVDVRKSAPVPARAGAGVSNEVAQPLIAE